MSVDIYTCVPINKSTASVVSQSGCTEELTKEQLLENMRAKKKRLMETMLTLPKNSDERKLIGKELHNLNNKLKEVKDSIRARPQDLHHYIIEILKERMTTFQWKLIVDQAIERQKIDLKK